MIISNNSNIPLGLAVWAVDDDYDYHNEPNYVSVTTLMKPLKHIILPKRVPKELQTGDVEDLIASAMGKSLHTGVEVAWKERYKKNLKKLGYPDGVIERIIINPEPADLKPDSIPVYLEQRSKKVVNGYTVGGKYDMITEGILTDTKSTSAFTWMFGGKDDDYRLQGSLYRWLNQDKVTEDFIRINFIFTDWKKSDARTNPKYPQKRVLSRDIPLMTIEETERWVLNKLALIEKFKDSPEEDIPECTEDELWRSADTHKYYSDPAKTDGKSLKNFDDQGEAHQYLITVKGGKGVIKTVKGTVKRCEYCDAAPVCKQKEKYLNV